MSEKRYYRLEDWKGNIYYQDTSSNESTAGMNFDASLIDEKGSGVTSDGSVVVDATANGGKAVVLTAGSGTTKNLLTATFNNIKFAKYAMYMRLKSSVGSGSSTYFTAKCYYVDNTGANPEVLLSTTNITGDNIGVANKYMDLGFITDFRGTYTSSVGLKIVITMTNCTAYIDSVSAQKAFVGVTGLNTSYNV